MTRKVAAAELILGLVPTTLVYLYYIPLGAFAIVGGLMDLRKGLWHGWIVGSVVAVFIIGGATLPALWALWLGRYRGQGIGGPRWLVVPLVLLGFTTCAALVVASYVAEAEWYFWYVFLAPLAVAARSTPHMVAQSRRGGAA